MTQAVARRVSSTDIFCAVLALAVVAKFAFSGVLLDAGGRGLDDRFHRDLHPGRALSRPRRARLDRDRRIRAARRSSPAPCPTRPALAVPVAGLAGCALPGCECGSVPVASALMSRGVAVGPAIAFLLSAPAINPVVLTATAVAFPGHPMVVLARFLASLLAAVVVGWIWQRLGRDVPAARPSVLAADADRWTRARLTASHDLAQSLGLLCIGAAGAATLNVALPRRGWTGWPVRPSAASSRSSLLAVLIAVCSEADAFIASSLTQFSLTARLAFMVVGPAIDVKLFALQAGTFGWPVARRLAPLTLVVAAGSAAPGRRAAAYDCSHPVVRAAAVRRRAAAARRPATRCCASSGRSCAAVGAARRRGLRRAGDLGPGRVGPRPRRDRRRGR